MLPALNQLPRVMTALILKEHSFSNSDFRIEPEFWNDPRF